VAEFRLTNRAEQDLDSILTYSMLTFGERQTIRYLRGLVERFDLLAGQPLLGRSILFAGRKARRYNYESHVIFYRSDDNGVLILAIVHGNAALRHRR
jgi:toxin ParE1/3/4